MQANSMRNSLIILIAFLLAIWLGVTIVTEQTETILKIAGVALVLTCVFLGRRIWLLSIFFMALNVPLIRGFGSVELGQVLFLGFTFIIILMRRQPFKFKFGELEVWMLLLAGCILQVYFRNPVGLGMFGSGDVGGRPYFVVALSFITAVVLGNIVIKPNEIKWAMKLTIIGSFLGYGLSALLMRGGGVPGATTTTANVTLGETNTAGRIGTLAQISSTIARIVSSYVSPLRGLLHFFWAPLILISLAAAAGSGYRNAIANVGLIYLVGLTYRGGFSSVIMATISGAMGLGALAFWNLAAPLPGNIQRALSPFPGTWEERHVEGAEASTEWRVEMWKEALFTDYWIRNKLLGDGLGLSSRELEMLQASAEGGHGLDSMGSGMSRQQEEMMITGGYHSGPVQCVRIVGYVGLLVVLLAMIRVAVHAHRQILRCRRTEWYPIALFFGIPIIVLPFFYIFIFGDFTKDVSATLLAYGIIRLLERNLPLPAYEARRHVPYILRQQRKTNEENRPTNANFVTGRP